MNMIDEISFYSDDCLKSLMNLASVEPSLNYRQNLLITPSTSTNDVINEYFSAQPACYTNELEEYIHINRVNPVANIFVFVVCYNELPNLKHMVKLYERQRGNVNFQVTFLINYTVSENAEKNLFDEETLLESVKVLLELKEKHNFIHVIAKRFSPDVGGLARARKYAMDYSLLACSKTKNPDSGVLISNEGDTLEIENDYLYAYSRRIGAGLEYFVQGRVKYPSIIYNAPLLKLYVDVRERVHIGQGLNEHRYPGFEGLMPIGRNYGIHPKIACFAGGIDPVALKGAEDDQMLGFDIYHRLGNEVKHYAEDIVLTTNPRREILIVNSLLNGKGDDAKSMYEDFHNNKSIYDSTWNDYVYLIDHIGKFENNQHNRCLVVNQFYQWVMRTVFKNYFWIESDMQNITKECRCHNIGYWVREDKLSKLYKFKLKKLTEVDKDKLLTIIVAESLFFFNELISGVGHFTEASIDYNSNLVM